MQTLGAILIIIAGAAALVTCLHVIGTLRVVPLSPEILMIIIPGLIFIGIFAVPGALLWHFGKPKIR